MAQSSAERRAAQRALREQIKTNTYQRSSIGRASAAATRKAVASEYVNHMNQTMGHRGNYNEDNVRKYATGKDPKTGAPYMTTSQMRGVVDMNEEEIVDLALLGNQGQRHNPGFYH